MRDLLLGRLIGSREGLVYIVPLQVLEVTGDETGTILGAEGTSTKLSAVQGDSSKLAGWE